MRVLYQLVSLVCMFQHKEHKISPKLVHLSQLSAIDIYAKTFTNQVYINF